ncbi:MAG TPA: sigma-70 family RNA polymerase sigma factor, partial [Streptosporangiaceae bacterium]|nr:sigma-70 family RNA polymerase sigma factor [Streptosporangiaceae bacterium]
MTGEAEVALTEEFDTMPAAVPGSLAAAGEPDNPDPAVLSFAGAAGLDPAGIRAGEVAESDPAEIAEAMAEAPRIQHGSRERTHARELFERLCALPPDNPERLRIRGELVELHLPLVEYLARRFRNRGEWLDDLTQVATIGLIKSIDRFDLDRGVEFSTYATPTIVGEIKRHFRDKGWSVRVPR